MSPLGPGGSQKNTCSSVFHQVDHQGMQRLTIYGKPPLGETLNLFRIPYVLYIIFNIKLLFVSKRVYFEWTCLNGRARDHFHVHVQWRGGYLTDGRKAQKINASIWKVMQSSIKLAFLFTKDVDISRCQLSVPFT